MSNINKLYVGGEIYNLSTNVDDVVVTLTMWDSPLGQTIDERINNTIPKPNNIAEYNTDIDSYDIVDDDTPDGFELNEKIRIHTNYEDLTIPTTFSAPWGNNRVVIVSDDDIPGYISLAGVHINEIALIYGYTYELICTSHVDNTYTWVVTNKSGTEPVGLLFVSNENLTQDQKLAIYKYMASINATGERIANSLGIDYCLYEEQTDNDVKLFRIVVKYVDANIKCDYYEGKTADGSTFITNSCTDIDPHDLIPIIAEFDTIKLLCKDMQEDIKNLQAAVEPIEELSESIEFLQSDVEGNAERINKQSGFFSALWDGNNTISVYGIDDALRQRLINVSEVETEVSVTEEPIIINQPNPNKRCLPLLLPVIDSASVLAALNTIKLYTRDYDEENTSAPANSYSLRVVDANGTTVTASSNITPAGLCGYSGILYIVGSPRICYLKLFAEIKVNPVVDDAPTYNSEHLVKSGGVYTAIENANAFLFGGQVSSPAELPSKFRRHFANKMLKVKYDRVKDVGYPGYAGGEYWWHLAIYPMSYFYKMLKLEIDKSCMGYTDDGNIEVFLLPADYATHFPSHEPPPDAADQWVRDNKIELELVDENTEFFDDNETVKRFSRTYKLYDDSPSADYVVAINYWKGSVHSTIVTYNNRIDASYMLIPYVIIDGKKCYYHDETYLYDNSVLEEFFFNMPNSDIRSLSVYFDLPNGKAWLGNRVDKYVLANDGEGNYPKAVENNSELYKITYEWQPI